MDLLLYLMYSRPFWTCPIPNYGVLPYFLMKSPALLIDFQSPMETQVSTMDPTPLFPAPSFSRLNKELSSLYVQVTKTDSHPKFVSVCLHNHIFPNGLRFKIQPCVPKSPCQELASRLENDWTRIIERTCREVLTALKLYHKGCAHHFRRQADDLEASILAWFGRTRMRLIRKEAKAAFTKESFHLREWWYNKLNKLYLPDSCIKK